jgi:hypothetical protein
MNQTNSIGRAGGMLRSARITGDQNVAATCIEEADLCQCRIIQTNCLEVSVAVWNSETVMRSGVLRSMEAGGT